MSDHLPNNHSEDRTKRLAGMFVRAIRNRFTGIVIVGIFITVVGGIMSFLLDYLPAFIVLALVYSTLLGGTVFLIAQSAGLPLTKGLPPKVLTFFSLISGSVVALIYAKVLDARHDANSGLWYLIGLGLGALLTIIVATVYLMSKFRGRP
jgi:hypothetical protein